MEEAEEMFETLEEARERLEELKKERNKLLEANKKMARILVAMDEDLKASGMEMDEMNEHTYSFHDGWNSRKEEIRIEDISEDAVDQQLKQLNQLLSNEDIL